MTTSTPRSPHGSAAGPSAMDHALITWSPTTMSSPTTDTSCAKRPRTESYLSRCAKVSLSVRSLTATISMSVVPAACCASTARKKFRPTREAEQQRTRSSHCGRPFFAVHDPEPRTQRWPRRRGGRSPRRGGLVSMHPPPLTPPPVGPPHSITFGPGSARAAVRGWHLGRLVRQYTSSFECSTDQT